MRQPIITGTNTMKILRSIAFLLLTLYATALYAAGFERHRSTGARARAVQRHEVHYP